MKRKQLGKTGLIVSEIGFGSIPITRVEVPEGVDIIRHCFELGVYIKVIIGQGQMGGRVVSLK